MGHSYHFVSALPGTKLEPHDVIIKPTVSQEAGSPPVRRLRWEAMMSRAAPQNGLNVEPPDFTITSAYLLYPQNCPLRECELGHGIHSCSLAGPPKTHTEKEAARALI